MHQILPLLRVHGRYWLRHKLQAGLCIGGVSLGVALFCAIRLANAGALASFSGAVDAFMGKATHRVFSPAGAGVPDEVFARLAGSPGVDAASPLLQDRMRLEGVPGEVQVLGVDPVSDADFRSEALIGPREDPDALPNRPAAPPLNQPAPMEVLLGLPDSALVPARLARLLRLRPGDAFRAYPKGLPRSFVVAGVFAPPRDQEELLGNTVILDVATHQEAFGKVGRLDAIRLILQPEATAAVAKLLPAGVTLEAVGRRMERVERMSHAFQVNLEALGLFSLLVGAFLILNAATFSVVQRESLVALQRCIGASRRAVWTALMLEAGLVGALGGALGVALGWVLAQRLVLGTSATVQQVILDADPFPAHAPLSAGTWLLCLSLGIATALGGSFFPAFETFRVPPLRALAGSRGVSGQTLRLGRWGLGAGAAAGLAGVAFAWPSRTLEWSLGGATAAILAGALLCPSALWAAGTALSPLLSRIFGITGMLAARQLTRSVSRTGLASASLMVALSLALSVGITVASFRATFDIWLEQTLTADLYLGPASDRRDFAFSAEFLRAARALPFVEDFAELRTRRVAIADRDVLVVAVDAATFVRRNRVPLKEGDRARAADALAAGGAWVSETLSYTAGLKMGDRMMLPGAGGPVPLRIAAIVQNYSVPNGLVYVNQRTFRGMFGDTPSGQAAVWLKPGVSSGEAMRAIGALPGGEAVSIALNRQLRAGAMRVFERTFAITHLMTGLAAAVALIAVISASAALLEERRSLISQMRAIGVTRRRLALAMALEASLLAVVSGIMSWLIGTLVSALLVFVVNRRAFGWTLQFLPGSGSYLTLLLWAVAAALLGSSVAIFRMWRSPILAGLRGE